ncbi:cyclic pyranopterin phosphate synthase [Pseudoduganella flava]|uniref:GTP 3',8-cyclase n=1 Tax=Pseudoduganella flava TaxID=871742 RepID=A0A562PSK1_9BURK|nr:GTP 3',8-cyclase MoaA [Pseudoduganella flava]QGZ39284.1 GTP 3',8-cyclase MoaA [Pseudoduganella flava]TWI47415.1 cyclic pyranopterin phosphate synthase [Pseudoduganella flava]
MTEKIIILSDGRSKPLTIPADLAPPTGEVRDRLARPLRDLRISITDRCNFRCVYCMPKEVFDKDYQYLPHSSLLTFEEIARVARQFVAHGVEKIRLTGGEPLLRKNIERLIEMLAQLTTVDGKPLDLTLTTNGSLLARKAKALKEAGLQRVTVSLDALDDATFRAMNDVDFAVADVLEGIEAAYDAGLGPIKVNMVVKAGMNEQEILPMARHFRNTPHILRFIEFMDVGASNGWNMKDVIPSAEIVRRIGAEMPLAAIDPNYTGETAARWRYTDGGGEIGVISSVTQAFCRDCTRARLSTEGKLYTCLFATQGHDLRALLREGHSDAELSAAIGELWRVRGDRYSELRTINTDGLARTAARKVEMSYIGG